MESQVMRCAGGVASRRSTSPERLARMFPGPGPFDTVAGAGGFPGQVRGIVWLGFLGIPLADTFSERGVSAPHLAVTVLALLAFVAVDIALMLWWHRTADRRLLLAGLLSLVALSAFLVFYDQPGWAFAVVYTVFPALRLFGSRMSVVAAVAAAGAALGGAGGLPAGSELALPLITIGAGTSMFGVNRLLEANDTLRRAQADRAKVAVEQERLRFARDLHDLLGHSLSVITLKSELAGRLVASDPGRAAVEVAEIEQTARQALREVREVVSGYRKASLSVELAGARTALAAGGVRWTEDLADADLPPAVEEVVAWTLREGVTNVVRHSRATSCALRLDVDSGVATVSVTDDGAGGAGGGGSEPGFGLVGLAERVNGMGGSIEAGPRPDGGFELKVSVLAGAPR